MIIYSVRGFDIISNTQLHLKLTHMLTGLGVEVVVILVKSVEEPVLEVLIVAFHPSGVDRI